MKIEMRKSGRAGETVGQKKCNVKLNYEGYRMIRQGKETVFCRRKFMGMTGREYSARPIPNSRKACGHVNLRVEILLSCG